MKRVRRVRSRWRTDSDGVCSLDTWWFCLVTSTNLSPVWRKEESSMAWTLATRICGWPVPGGRVGGGEREGERGGEAWGKEGEWGRAVGGKSW